MTRKPEPPSPLISDSVRFAVNGVLFVILMALVLALAFGVG